MQSPIHQHAYLSYRLRAIDAGQDLFVQGWQLPAEVRDSDLYRPYVLDAHDVLQPAVQDADGTWCKPPVN